MAERSGKALASVRFPSLTVRDLERRARSLPQDFEGNSNLVVVAFRREQQPMVDSWTARFDAIEAQHRHVRCYEVPAIATRWAPVRCFIDGGMAEAMREHGARRHTLTVYTDVRRVADADTGTMTVLVVNSDGRGYRRATGPATGRAGDELVAALTGNEARDIARFEPWTYDTPIDNVRDVCRTGLYQWCKAIRPRGVRSLSREPVPSLAPLGSLRCRAGLQ